MMWLLACMSEPPPEPPPDVLLVVLDTVRADHLQTYGYARDTSYQLNAIAEAGVVFEDATVSGAWTWPGHAELFTGEPPWVTGAHYVDVPGPVPVARMRRDLPTLAERFDGAGYRTVSVATNKLLDPDMGLVRGFEAASVEASDADTVRVADAALAVDDERPLLLFVNLASAHAPYNLVEGVPFSDAHKERVLSGDGEILSALRVELDGEVGVDPSQECGGLRCDLQHSAGTLIIDDADMQVLRDLYDANLVLVDNALKALIAAWTSERGGVVVVTADHGEAFGEHGVVQHRLVTVPATVRVPLVAVGPGFEAGTRCKTSVMVGDIYPTLLGLAGIDEAAWDLLDAAAGTPRPERIEAAAWPFPDTAHVPLVSQRWGYVAQDGRWGAASGERRLGDPALAEEAASVGAESAEGSGMLGGAGLERLRALGYL